AAAIERSISSQSPWVADRRQSVLAAFPPCAFRRKTARMAFASRGQMGSRRAKEADMQVPLTPLEFARRTRRLYADREALVDEGLRLTYSQFFDRCDRWSSALQGMRVRHGDRVAYIAPNTHAQLKIGR